MGKTAVRPTYSGVGTVCICQNERTCLVDMFSYVPKYLSSNTAATKPTTYIADNGPQLLPIAYYRPPS
ncbi:uncharacterized protein LAJ45_06297 [Morchella importuna]|uniref:uncharacterized protein n=1 Tax=Morchella importuna TaxID=1174673 RepID=UPI001E8E13D9|nr:uncharacterized protein LAJ45_06297 [Morchella importuna]KAH8149666.1 hypothetical protein LAJ45_06297 [Morchella importuna]